MLLQAPVPLEEKAARQPDDVNTLALVLATDHQPANRNVSPLDGDRVLRYDVCQASQDRPRLGCREVLSKLLYEVVGPRVPQAPGNPIGMLAQGGVVDGLEKSGGQFLMHCDQLTMDRALDATQQPEHKIAMSHCFAMGRQCVHKRLACKKHIHLLLALPLVIVVGCHGHSVVALQWTTVASDSCAQLSCLGLLPRLRRHVELAQHETPEGLEHQPHHHQHAQGACLPPCCCNAAVGVVLLRKVVGVATAVGISPRTD